LIKSRYKTRLLIIAAFLLVFFLAVSCSHGQDFDSHLDEVVKPYRFNILGWEVSALTGEVGLFFSGRYEITDDNNTAVLDEFFERIDRIRNIRAQISAIEAGTWNGDVVALRDEIDELRLQNAKLKKTVERILETQIREVLSQQGIYNPLDRCIALKIGFPPMNFHLATPPHLLVVSPRDRIERIKEVTLLPKMSTEDMEYIEDELDGYDVSSLVVSLGGMATYPSYVTDEADMKFIVEAAAEEWLHQYLAFTPLGFLYLMNLAGIRRNYDIVTMNETAVGIVSEEIGAIVLKQYYGIDTAEPEPAAPTTGFDFNKEMREIRKAVDDYLAEGEIEKAEAFMDEKRLYLADNGYHIRKLNQAYFAFHGAYADSPTSISPIGAEMKELRNRSTSLKAFLDGVAGMTSRQDLADSVK
jgi:hypothetical protein